MTENEEMLFNIAVEYRDKYNAEKVKSANMGSVLANLKSAQEQNERYLDQYIQTTYLFDILGMEPPHCNRFKSAIVEACDLIREKNVIMSDRADKITELKAKVNSREKEAKSYRDIYNELKMAVTSIGSATHGSVIARIKLLRETYESHVNTGEHGRDSGESKYKQLNLKYRRLRALLCKYGTVARRRLDAFDESERKLKKKVSVKNG